MKKFLLFVALCIAFCGIIATSPANAQTFIGGAVTIQGSHGSVSIGVNDGYRYQQPPRYIYVQPAPVYQGVNPYRLPPNVIIPNGSYYYQPHYHNPDIVYAVPSYPQNPHYRR